MTYFHRQHANNPEAMSTEEFVRIHVFGEANRQAARRQMMLNQPERSTEDYLRYEVFGERPQASVPPPSRSMNQPASVVAHLEQSQDGRIAFKIEENRGSQQQIEYAYDAQGRLADVWRNGQHAESYQYNHKGQRVSSATTQACRHFAYASNGALVRAGENHYTYSPEGSLTSITGPHGTWLLHYGSDTRLDTVITPDGRRIRYRYGKHVGPDLKYIDGHLVEEYVWKADYQLAEWLDYASGEHIIFEYGNGPVPVAARAIYNGTTFLLHYDQVGTLKKVTTKHGQLITEKQYDSFGNLLHDTNPAFFLPIGFAGGLPDRDTGLIRFGYRDYDPTVGRFTAKDPANDRRGDGDLWDYCVDDPVNAKDPSGLIWANIAGAVIGGGINAYNHWDKSGMEFAKKVAIGAAAGALGSGVGSLAGKALGTVGGSIIGGAAGGAANEAALQADEKGKVEDWDNVGKSAALGAFAGGAGGKATQFGNKFIKMPDVIGKTVKQSKVEPYGAKFGVAGDTVGNIIANKIGEKLQPSPKDKK